MGADHRKRGAQRPSIRQRHRQKCGRADRARVRHPQGGRRGKRAHSRKNHPAFLRQKAVEESGVVEHIPVGGEGATMTLEIEVGTCETKEETFFYYKIGGTRRKHSELVNLARAVAEDVAAGKLEVANAAELIFVAARILPLKNAKDEYVFDNACFIATATAEQSPNTLSDAIVSICAHLEEMFISKELELKKHTDFSPSYSDTWHPNMALMHRCVSQTTQEQQAWPSEEEAA